MPVDAEKLRDCDGQAICFDWLVWKAIHSNVTQRPPNGKSPLVVAVQHQKNERQIPAEFEPLWEDMRNSDLVYIENVSHWNMNSKRMEAQAKQGDILITIGGTGGRSLLGKFEPRSGQASNPSQLCIEPRRSRLLTLGRIGDVQCTSRSSIPGYKLKLPHLDESDELDQEQNCGAARRDDN